IESWFKKYKKIAIFYGWDNATSVNYLPLFLDGTASDAFDSIPEDSRKDIDKIKTHLINKLLTSDPYDAFHSRTLQPNETFRDFGTDLLRLATRMLSKNGDKVSSGVVDGLARAQFLSGLPSDIADKLRLLQLDSLEDVIQRAETISGSRSDSVNVFTLPINPEGRDPISKANEKEKVMERGLVEFNKIDVGLIVAMVVESLAIWPETVLCNLQYMQRFSKRSQSLVPITLTFFNADNAVVAAIMKIKRGSGGRLAQRENCPVLQKYLILLQEFFPVSEWSRFEVTLVNTNYNDADRLTRHPFLTKLLAFRDTLLTGGIDIKQEDDSEKPGYVHIAAALDHTCAACDTTIPTKLGVSVSEVRAAQEDDAELKAVQKAIKGGLLINPTTDVLRFYARVAHELRIIDGVLYRYCAGPRKEGPLHVPVLPEKLIPQVVKQAHDFGHLDVQGTVDVLRTLYFFPWMWKRTYDEVGKCERCLLNQKPDAVLPMRATVTSIYPWQVLHMDIVSYGNLHLLTLIDSFSKYLCWENLYDMSSTSIAGALQKSITKLGPPRVMICDNAHNIGGPAVKSLLSKYNVDIQKSTEYYPRGNSVAERVHKTLHRLARLYQLRSPNDVRRELHKLVYVYNCKPHRALGGRSPYQVLFGRLPHVPANGRYYDIGQLYAIWDEVRIVQGETFRKNKLYYDARRHAEQRDQSRYAQGQAVLLYLKRSAALGVPNKLGDAWEPGWKIVRGPDER
ncbi:hypothetical protein FOZ63_028143, partial [Perkinsus olseni]